MLEDVQDVVAHALGIFHKSRKRPKEKLLRGIAPRSSQRRSP
jgi:hypothetical protein